MPLSHVTLKIKKKLRLGVLDILSTNKDRNDNLTAHRPIFIFFFFFLMKSNFKIMWNSYMVGTKHVNVINFGVLHMLGAL